MFFGQMQKVRLSDRAIPAESVPAVTFPVHCASQPGVRCPGPETPHSTQLVPTPFKVQSNTTMGRLSPSQYLDFLE